MAEIPTGVLRALNEGREETITLVEWLAIDPFVLLKNILPEVGLGREARTILEKVQPLRAEKILRRMNGIGAALHEVLKGRRGPFEALASHPSDMVRAWAAGAIKADAAMDLERRLRACRRFAADRAMSVRECAWDAFRPHLARELARGLRLLRPWVRDADPNVRRCASEATRPRGVWTNAIGELQAKPELGLPLLEPLRSDPSRYVQNSVANWLNDAGKSRPGWVKKVCARWRRESPTEETGYIVRRALRSFSG